MELKEDAQSYLQSVIRHWWVVVVSIFLAVIGAAQDILQSIWSDFVMPAWVWAVILFTGLSIAQFLAWRDMKRHRDSLKRYNVNQSILSELASLRDRLISHQNVPINDGTELGQWIEQFKGIRNEVDSVLKKVSDAEYRGYNHIGIFPLYAPPPSVQLSDKEYQQYANWRSRVIRDHKWLEKFIHDYSRNRFRADLAEVAEQDSDSEVAVDVNSK